MNVNFVSELVEKFRNAILPKDQREERKKRNNLDFRKAKNDQSEVLTEEEKLDITIDDSFPASDPPGHIAKSAEDLKQY